MNLPGLPQIPTDNLYKFKALGGLFVFVVALLLLSKLMLEEVVLRSQFDEQRSRSAQEWRRARERSERVIERLQQRDTAGYAVGRRTQDSLYDLATRSDAEIQRTLERVHRHSEYWDVTELVLSLFALLGLALSVQAFHAWDHKHQRFQDRLLMAETERVELELARLRRENASDTLPPDVNSGNAPFVDQRS